MAYRREAFLPAALDSLRQQTLPTEEFEVLIPARADPAPLAPHLEGLQVRWRAPPEAGAGRTFADLARGSRGEVLVLLDDDDVFVPRKLEIVDRAFREDAELGYFHNNMAIMDDRGGVLDPHPFRSAERAARARVGVVRIAGPDPWSQLRRFPPLIPDFNHSSLAVRRSVVEGRLDSLERMPAGVEEFFFLSTILSGHAILLHPEVLTYYRIHNLNDTVAGPGVDPIQVVRAITDRALQGYEEAARMGQESGDPLAAREMDELVRVHRVYAALRQLPRSRRTMLAAWRRARELRDSYTWTVENAGRIVDAAALLYLASPRLAQRMYRRRLLARMQPPRDGGL